MPPYQSILPRSMPFTEFLKKNKTPSVYTFYFKPHLFLLVLYSFSHANFSMIFYGWGGTQHTKQIEAHRGRLSRWRWGQEPGGCLKDWSTSGHNNLAAKELTCQSMIVVKSFFLH